MKGLFLDAVLTRDVPGVNSPDTDDFDPPLPTEATYACKAIRENYGVGLRAGGLVNAEDVKIIILQRSLAVTPQPLDRIVITEHGVTFSIVPGDSKGQPAVSADPANAVWECRARA